MCRCLAAVLVALAAGCAGLRPPGPVAEPQRWLWQCNGIFLVPKPPRSAKVARKLIGLDCVVYDRRTGVVGRLLMVPAPEWVPRGRGRGGVGDE